MRCPSCAQDNRESARYCDQCGVPLAAPAGAPAANPRAYTPRHVAERILTGRAALEGERKQVTVLFADVKDSMLLAERLGAEGWHRVLDRLFHLLAEGVHRFEGTVNQYTGDGVMALFGAPLALEDHAQRACHAVLYLRERLQAYAAQLRTEHGIVLAMRMGLNSGEVVVGRIGDDLRMDYTAQGHTVGLAQRVEQLAPTDGACLAPATAALVADYFELRGLGAFSLKGVHEPVQVHALVGPARPRTRLDVARARSGSRLVGRRAELARLEAALDEAAAGHGGVVAVVGEPGVGKTRLCLELLRRCRSRGVTVAQAHCPAHAASVALLPILDLLRSLFRIGEALRQLGPATAPLAPLACALLEVGEPDAPPLPAEQRQAQLPDFLRRLVQAQSAAGPLLLFVDDAHCADVEADAALSAIVEALGWTRTLLLVTVRPGHRPRWTQAPYYRELALDAFGDGDADALLRRLLGADASSAALRRLIAERTGGNPFFIEEVVLSLADRGALVERRAAGGRGRGRWRLAAPVTELVIPPTVQALVAARLDRLSERDKLVLQAAAVIGNPFTAAVLRHAIALPGTDDVERALEALRSGDFIRREPGDGDGVAYAFKHPLTQTVAYGAQLAEARSRLHVAVAGAIQALFPDRLGQHAPLLAHHFAAANWTYEAARWRRRAALRVTNIELGRSQRGRRGA